MGMGGLPGGSYILPGQGVPQGQLPLLCQPRGAGQQEGSGVQIQPGHGHAACPSPLPASLRSSPPPPGLCRGQQGLCEGPAAEQRQAAPMRSVPALHSGSAPLSSDTNGLN